MLPSLSTGGFWFLLTASPSGPVVIGHTHIKLTLFACVLKHIDTCCGAVKANKEVVRPTRISVPFYKCSIHLHVTHVTVFSQSVEQERLRLLLKLIFGAKSHGGTQIFLIESHEINLCQNQLAQWQESLGFGRVWVAGCSFINIMCITVKIAW